MSATGKMPVPQESSLFVEQASMSATGKMSVPQESSLFVEQASCLFLRMVPQMTTNLIAKHLQLNS
ncbi:hypothetical protein QUA44_23795 [Microcoleus sp. N9_A2]|uniref:hypothetical protein n=1 Tax=Microcoleus sp. N9_B2 TaxID=3055385 RepID=UPI002FD09B0A